MNFFSAMVTTDWHVVEPTTGDVRS